MEMEMAEFWARIAAGCGCTCCRGPIVPQSEPTTHHHAAPGAAGITLGTGLAGGLGDGLVGLDSVGRGTAGHMGAHGSKCGSLPRSSSPRPNLLTKDGLVFDVCGLLDWET